MTASQDTIGQHFSDGDFVRALSALGLCLQDYDWTPGANHLDGRSVVGAVRARGVTLESARAMLGRLIDQGVFTYRSSTAPAGSRPAGVVGGFPAYEHRTEPETSECLTTSRERWYSFLAEHRAKGHAAGATPPTGRAEVGFPPKGGRSRAEAEGSPHGEPAIRLSGGRPEPLPERGRGAGAPGGFQPGGALPFGPNAIALLRLLQDAPDRQAGIAVVDLPVEMRDWRLVTALESEGLVKFARRRHVDAGGKLALEPGWDVAGLAEPGRKLVREMIDEGLTEQVPAEIRLRLRITYVGDGVAARAAQLEDGVAIRSESKEQTPKERPATEGDGDAGRRGKRINERMKEMLEKDATRLDWAADRWAEVLTCSKSTVVGTPTWELIMNARALREAERVRSKNYEPADRRRFRQKRPKNN